MKICNKCGKEKELDDFVKNKKSLDGTGNTCKICYNEWYTNWYHSKNNAIKKKKYQDNLNKNAKRVSVRKFQLKKSFGISLDEYDEMKTNQNNCCAICGISGDDISKNFAVDHDHITGSNRGLLCTNCNFLLGCAKDNIFILINAIQYLKTWEEEI